MSAYTSRLVGVSLAAAAADQATKLVMAAAIRTGDHQTLALGVSLVHSQRTSVRSTTLTLVVAGVLVIAAIGGYAQQARRPRAGRTTWLAGGLLIGGAASSFLERAISGSTIEWLSLPVGPAISLAYVEMLLGASALFFGIGAARHRGQRQAGPRPRE